MKIVLFQTIQFKCEKTFLFQAIQFIQTVLIQLVQLSISTEVPYKTIRFSVSIFSMLKTFLFQAIQFSQTVLN